jgi:hypothetical protein
MRQSFKYMGQTITECGFCNKGVTTYGPNAKKAGKLRVCLYCRGSGLVDPATPEEAAAQKAFKDESTRNALDAAWGKGRS